MVAVAAMLLTVRNGGKEIGHWNCFDFLIVLLSIVSWIAEAFLMVFHVYFLKKILLS